MAGLEPQQERVDRKLSMFGGSLIEGGEQHARSNRKRRNDDSGCGKCRLPYLAFEGGKGFRNGIFAALLYRLGDSFRLGPLKPGPLDFAGSLQSVEGGCCHARRV